MNQCHKYQQCQILVIALFLVLMTFLILPTVTMILAGILLPAFYLKVRKFMGPLHLCE